jgi:inorganic phosphate transporter, PiT family
MTLLVLVVFVALLFEFINGFHDTANAIATSVATRVLTPRQAIMLATVTNLLGALWGTAVAKTIASGLIDASYVNSAVVLYALIGGIVWNLLTWWFGIPSSSSHALIGGLCGATLAVTNNDFSVIIWSQPVGTHWFEHKGILWKVLVPMFLSPLVGFTIGWMVMSLFHIVFASWRPTGINRLFGKIQILSAASMGFMHGTNDAQKTMGIITLALFAATTAGTFVGAPEWLQPFALPAPEGSSGPDVPTWVKIACAITMAAGTAIGGWRIIKTLGHKMARLQPIHGFAAETTSSAIILTATHFGVPISTTHNISASIMGVAAAKRLSSVKWIIVEQMVWAWILTFPCAAGIAYIAARILS